jgi:hypothetical protein
VEVAHIDGWEDRLKRSLYGSVISEVNPYPVVLSLEDMSGQRGSADKIFEASQKALKTKVSQRRSSITCYILPSFALAIAVLPLLPAELA